MFLFKMFITFHFHLRMAFKHRIPYITCSAQTERSEKGKTTRLSRNLHLLPGSILDKYWTNGITVVP